LNIAIGRIRAYRQSTHERRVLIAASLALALAGAVPLAGTACVQRSRSPVRRQPPRLAEILGALHYLRSICGANEGMKWRNEMQAVMDAGGAER